jgi:hypothetical protein
MTAGFIAFERLIEVDVDVWRENHMRVEMEDSKKCQLLRILSFIHSFFCDQFVNY